MVHHEKWKEHTRALPPLRVGDLARIQNQTGPHPTKWDRTGAVVEVHQHHQYTIKVDESGRMTLRNRQFLRKYTPVYQQSSILDDMAYPLPQSSAENTPMLHRAPTTLARIPVTTPTTTPATPATTPTATPSRSPPPYPAMLDRSILSIPMPPEIPPSEPPEPAAPLTTHINPPELIQAHETPSLAAVWRLHHDVSLLLL